MARLLFALAVVVVAFTVYALIDLILTDRARVRALNKVIWVFIIVLLPAIGGALWLVFGKSRRQRGGGAGLIAPDDDPAFLGGLERDLAAEERIRQLERELAELDDDSSKD
ncbi:PLD nuclease N-terminal domain-containing protein [Ruicaihuangia caeni]|uniref:PLD nuclease N-terminal domain-containing protein n=1 Tax=Ruicaihuangia caeni TaxID=3042517 RepID=A0AAW6TAR6_9MICO|nr:PLD nuclease N-terminal domain-containing protein [Klugiella sp. YN-L-19]MDI2098898.1 PLD nuclease N-terminal domain-containing protein [Klugiella sp. YN-L-19]